MITYNHEEYISKAIEGVLMQETDFPIELVIGEDFSTDKTREICQQYQKKYPQKIRLLERKNNLGMMPNFLNTLQNCRGKYIALCEGDDYWTDSLKLQKQVNFLENNPDFSICFHNVRIIREDDKSFCQLSNLNQKPVSRFEDLALESFIYTVSCVFKNNNLVFPEWYEEMAVGDWTLHLLNASYGKIRFLDEIMAVYRRNKGGVWGLKREEETYSKWIIVLKKCREHFYPRAYKEFSEQLSKVYMTHCFAYFDTRRYKDCRKAYNLVFPYRKYLNKRVQLALTFRYVLSFFPPIASYYTGFRSHKGSKWESF